MEDTYDPVVSGPEQVSLMQVRTLPRPRLGLALVLVMSNGELLTFTSDTPTRAGRFGRSRVAYWIDTAEHQLSLEAQLPSSDPAFVFLAQLSYRVHVSDPAAIASRQIRDIAELVRPRLVGAMRAATRRLDIADSGRAEETIERVLMGIECDPAVTVSNCHVELPVQADEAASSARSYRDTTRTMRLSGMKAAQMRELLAGGSPDLLALHLTHHPEDTGTVMEMLIAGDIAEGQNMLHAISIMYGRTGSDDEPFDNYDERRKLMDRFLARALPGGGGTEGHHEPPRLGGSRLRGSLARPDVPPPPRAIRGTMVESDDDGEPGPSPAPDSADASRRGEAPRSWAGPPRAPRSAWPPPGRRDPDLDDDEE